MPYTSVKSPPFLPYHTEHSSPTPASLYIPLFYHYLLPSYPLQRIELSAHSLLRNLRDLNSRTLSSFHQVPR